MGCIRGVVLGGRNFTVIKSNYSIILSAKPGGWAGALSIIRRHFSGKLFSCKYFFTLGAKTSRIHSIKHCPVTQALLHPLISQLTSSGQCNHASWASQPQKSVTLLPCPGGKTTKFTRTCRALEGGIIRIQLDVLDNNFTNLSNIPILYLQMVSAFCSVDKYSFVPNIN